MLATDWLLDQTEVVERPKLRSKVLGPASGTSMSARGRTIWEDMRRYKFICAGGGKKYSGPLKRLHPGARILGPIRRTQVTWGTASSRRPR